MRDEKIMHCRGIEPLPIAWKAIILPLDQQCLDSFTSFLKLDSELAKLWKLELFPHEKKKGYTIRLSH